MKGRPRAVVRSAVLAVNTPLAKARLNKAVRAASRPAKLEIGGLHQRDGWIVTNVNAITRNFMDATVRWPFEDGALSHVYADNVIEHISLDAGRALIAEAYRCTRPGGVIRLVTPDIRGHVELYLQGAGGIEGSVGQRYRSIGMVVEHAVDLLRIPIGQFGHHIGYVYDFESLADELTRAGFHSPTQGELGKSDHAEFVGIEQRAAEGNAQLVVEAVR